MNCAQISYEIVSPESHVYRLSLSKNYVSDWTVNNAIRELLQNALDSDSPFDVQFSPDLSDMSKRVMSIRSANTSLHPSKLILGCTGKAEDADAIGGFGEGFKLALLVLLRNNLGVVIENGGYYWEPSFEIDPSFGIETLHITETRNPGNCDLVFHVSGLTKEDVEEIEASCLHLQDPPENIIETFMGDILVDIPGKLYVNGLFVCDTQLAHSYNMHPRYISLGRDRATVSDFDLLWQTKDMWFASGKWDYIAEQMDARIKDFDYCNYSTPALVKEACYKVYKERYDGKILATSQMELESFVKAGMREVIVVPETFASVVRDHDDYGHAVRVITKTPTDYLQDWLRENKQHLRKDGKLKFKTLLDMSQKWCIV